MFSGSEAVTNIARGKPATQSSTLNGGVASRAVDGILAADTSGGYTEYGCTATNGTNDKNQWWKVDLQRPYAITEIKIFINGEECKFMFVKRFNLQKLTGNGI